MRLPSSLAGLLIAAATVWFAPARAQPVVIVAAENFYGDVAVQIGGAQAKVITILSAPAQDPHQFEATAAAARALADADIVIRNGAGYDPWVETLLASGTSAKRRVIVVADLLHRRAGDHPHVWYDPKSMRMLAAKIADELTARDPANSEYYRLRLKAFYDSLAPIRARIE